MDFFSPIFKKYYLFVYRDREKSIDIEFLYQSFEDMSSNIIQELDTKKHKIRSLSRMRSKGFFLYAL